MGIVKYFVSLANLKVHLYRFEYIDAYRISLIAKIMCLSDILTITALFLNFVALIIVTIQTIYTRRSLNAARKSIEATRKARELEILPRANFIIKVQTDLERWKKDLLETTGALEKAIRDKDSDLFREIANRSITSAKGLVDRYMYEKSPQWLSVIWVTGAQYYYDAKAPQRDLWNTETDEPNFSFGPDMISRFKESTAQIVKLISYINDIVPKVYLESPASLSDEDFLTNN